MTYEELVKALFDTAHSRFAAYLKAKERYGEDDPATRVNYFSYCALVEFFCDYGLDIAFFDSDNPTIM